MKMFTLIASTVVGGIIASAALTTPAAACTKSKWTKVGGSSLAGVIRGRDCGGNLSVKFYGGAGTTGWLSMKRTGANSLRATFVDANVTTKVRMKTNGASMNVFFKHIANGGAVSTTQGSYALVSYQ